MVEVKNKRIGSDFITTQAGKLGYLRGKMGKMGKEPPTF